MRCLCVWTTLGTAAPSATGVPSDRRRHPLASQMTPPPAAFWHQSSRQLVYRLTATQLSALWNKNYHSRIDRRTRNCVKPDSGNVFNLRSSFLPANFRTSIVVSNNLKSLNQTVTLNIMIIVFLTLALSRTVGLITPFTLRELQMHYHAISHHAIVDP